MKPAPKIEEKRDQCLINKPLGGKPHLHYINEQFLDDTNVKNLLLYIGVHGITIES